MVPDFTSKFTSYFTSRLISEFTPHFSEDFTYIQFGHQRHVDSFSIGSDMGKRHVSITSSAPGLLLSLGYLDPPETTLCDSRMATVVRVCSRACVEIFTHID